MSSLSQFVGGTRRVATIVNAGSSGGGYGVYMNSITPAVKTLAGSSLVASTYQTALSITGRGAVNFAHAQTSNASTKGVGLRITVDSRVIFDATSATVSIQPAITGIGSAFKDANNLSSITFQPIVFQTSLVIDILSTVTEATGVYLLVNYEVDV